MRISKVTGRLVKGGISRIRSEQQKIYDEMLSLNDAHAQKKAWSGVDSIKLASAPDTLVNGCLVLEGGSFRGCYTSGVLDVLMENGINLQTVIGTSAGALNGYNYVAGMIGRAAKINLAYRHDLRFFSPTASFRNKGVVGFDFILNNIEDELPFDHERFELKDRRFIVTVTDCDEGEVVYCEKGKMTNFLRAVQASASMPYVSEMVDVNGINGLDGGCTMKIPYKWALDNDFEKILVIRTRVRDYRREPESEYINELIDRLYQNYPKLAEKLKQQDVQYNNACDELEKLEAAGKVMMICPSGSIEVSHIEGDCEKLGALYLLGRADAMIALPKIKEYLGVK